MRTSKWLSVLLILIVSACGKPLPTLTGIDPESWTNDPNACTGKRTSMMNAIRSEKEKLLSLSELQVVELLGKPDQNELYKRNQKFYYYFLQPASACGEGMGDPLRLVIRFNAMGLAKEVSVE